MNRKKSPDLVVRRIRGMGRAVFSGRRYRKGEIIEVCPVVPLSKPFGKQCDGEILEHYLFQWGDTTAIALGFGSIYNHSFDPNASFRPRMARLEMVFRATRTIEPGEQILIDYEWDKYPPSFRLLRRDA